VNEEGGSGADQISGYLFQVDLVIQREVGNL
jgi:hypothetical protein